MTENHNLKTKLDYALYYWQLGFSVIPLKSNPPKDRKKPAVPEWTPYMTERASEEQIRKWFENSDYNIGLIMGAISGHIAIDIDGQTAEQHTAEKIPEMSVNLRTALANTIVNRTGSGGQHAILKIGNDISIDQLEVWANNEKHSQILIQGNGHYIVAPPSIHPNGNIYETNGKLPQLITKQELDEFIRLVGNKVKKEQIQQSQEPTPFTQALTIEMMEKLLERIKPSYTEGRRDRIVFHLSGAMRKDAGYSIENVKTFVKLLCNATNDEELENRLLTVENTYKQPLENINGRAGLFDVLIQGFDGPALLEKTEDYKQIITILTGKKLGTTQYTASGHVKGRQDANILYDLARVHVLEIIKDEATNDIYAVCAIEGKKEIYNVESLAFQSYLRTLFEKQSESLQSNITIAFSKVAQFKAKVKDLEEKQAKGENIDTKLLREEKAGLEEAQSEYDSILEIYHDKVPSKESVNNATAQLISKIDREVLLQNRVFWNRKDNILYFNLADNEGNIIKITADPDGKGVTKVKNSDLCLFKKLSSKKAQVTPTDTFDPNRRYFKELNEGVKFKHSHHEIIDEVYGLSLFIPGISHPLYFPFGPERSGKSTAQVKKKALADPFEFREAGTFEERFAITLQQLETDDRKEWDRALLIESNWITYFDNNSYVTKKIMDELCSWIQPGYYKGKEKKYYNKELSEIGGKRPIGINGRVYTFTQTDIIARTFAPEFEEREVFADTEAMLKQFCEARPEILAYAFGILSKFLYLYEKEGITIIPKSPNGLTTFEKVGELLSRCIGNKEGEFQEAWLKNTEDQTEVSIEGSSLAQIVITYVQQSGKKELKVQPIDVYRELKTLGNKLGYDLDNDNTFPSVHNELTKSLKKYKVVLKREGIDVITGEKEKGSRIIKFINLKYEEPKPNNPSQPQNIENQDKQATVTTVQPEKNNKPVDTISKGDMSKMRYFDMIFDGIAKDNDERIVHDKKLRSELISSGQFTSGEAHQFIKDSLSTNRIYEVRPLEYKRA